MLHKLFFITLFLFVNCKGDIPNPDKNKYLPEPGKYSETVKFDYDSIVHEMKNLLTEDFIIKTNSCFVITGNISESKLQNIIDNTIISAEECFYNNYFEKKPDEIIKIFLFKDDKSYRLWAKRLYNDEDDLSPYGYYKSSKRAMLMNISTGLGTLVHELTHAFVRYDFPDIPSWFNEGLGSLYERCSMNNKEIKGHVNWRLPTLQKSIKEKTYTSLENLVSTDDEEFYGKNSGFYYSQARYLCIFLQEKGLLVKFYKTFRDRFIEDNTGKKFLEQILNKSISEIDSEFKTWSLTLILDD